MGFAKILAIYLCISMALMIGTYQANANGTDVFMRPTDLLSDFLVIHGIGENMTIGKGGNLSTAINDTNIAGGLVSQTPTSTGDQGFLATGWSFIKLLFNLWWIPVAVMIDIQAPFPLTLLMAVFPILFLTYLYGFIRGGIV